MTKNEITSNETLLNYCYEKAKKNVLRNWKSLSEKEIKENESIIIKEFLNLHDRINLDEELEKINKYYLGSRLEKEVKKCLNKYRSCTSVFIGRFEYIITKEVM